MNATRFADRQWQDAVLALALVGVLFVTVWLRLYGIGGTLPFLYDPDEGAFVVPAVKILASGDWNPHWFGHPGTTVIYTNAVLFAAVRGLTTVIGLDVPANITAHYDADPGFFHFLGRLLQVVWAVASVSAIYLTAKELLQSKLLALLAALLAAVLPFYVGFSQIVRTDIPAALFVTLALYFSSRLAATRSVGSYIAAGAMVGFGVATKYPSVVAAVPIVVAHLWGNPFWLRHWWKLLLAGAASVVATFAASPFMFLDFAQVLADVARESGARIDNPGAGFAANLARYLTYIYGVLDPPLTVAAALGIAGGLLQRKLRLLLPLVFLLPFLLFISMLSLWWARWLIPAVPAICILVAGGAGFVGEALGRFGRVARLAALSLIAVALVAAIVPHIRQTLYADGRKLVADTRTLSRQWIVDNLSTQSSIALERYTPQLPTDRFELFDFRRADELRAAPTSATNFIAGGTPINARDSQLSQLTTMEYVVLSSGSFARYRDNPKLDKQWAIYQRILALGEIVYDSKKQGYKSPAGPQILVLKINNPAPNGSLAPAEVSTQ